MMKKLKSMTIAAALVATVVISACTLSSCEGRKMSNMTPSGETVEVVIDTESDSTASADVNP